MILEMIIIQRLSGLLDISELQVFFEVVQRNFKIKNEIKREKRERRNKYFFHLISSFHNQQLEFLNLQKMFISNLSEKISDSNDDLGKLLDGIYKFPQKQRKQYFEKISSVKNQLAALKTNLKEMNALQTEKQYNSLILAIASLKSQIEEQINLNLNKQNRNADQSGFIRQSKKTHEEALRLLAEKDQQIERLQLECFQKEELIKINYQEMKDYQRDCYYLSEENNNLKRAIREMEKDLVSLNQDLKTVSNQVIYLRELSSDQDRQLTMNSEIIEKNTNQLIIARDKILHFEELAELNMRKACLVQQNVRKVEEQASELNANYKQKEEDSLKREKEMEKIKIQLTQKQEQILTYSKENSELLQQINLLEKQINLLQRTLFNERKEAKESKETLQTQISELYLKVRDLQTEKKQKLAQLKVWEDKFADLYQKCQDKQYEKQILEKEVNELKIIDNNCVQQLQKLTLQMELIRKENLFLNKQKDILSQQTQKALQIKKDYELQIQDFKKKCKNNQYQRVKLSQQINTQEIQIKQAETAKINYQIICDQLKKQISELKSKQACLEEDKQINEHCVEDLKKKLLKAKIEAVREIRTSMKVD